MSHIQKKIKTIYQRNHFFRLGPNWGKRKALRYSFEKVLLSTQTSNFTITDESVVPLTVNSTHQHIHQNISLESTMGSEKIQCNLCKKIVKSTKGLKIHQKKCRNNLLDDKDKLVDAVSESHNLVTRAIEDTTQIKLVGRHLTA